jgi:DMSO/TMAO reductase YedYZ heme-binding membrane subunit
MDFSFYHLKGQLNAIVWFSVFYTLLSWGEKNNSTQCWLNSYRRTSGIFFFSLKKSATICSLHKNPQMKQPILYANFLQITWQVALIFENVIRRLNMKRRKKNQLNISGLFYGFLHFQMKIKSGHSLYTPWADL